MDSGRSRANSPAPPREPPGGEDTLEVPHTGQVIGRRVGAKWADDRDSLMTPWPIRDKEGHINPLLTPRFDKKRRDLHPGFDFRQRLLADQRLFVRDGQLGLIAHSCRLDHPRRSVANRLRRPVDTTSDFFVGPPE